MLIGISGTLSSGKTEVARYLTFQGFKLLSFGENTEEDSSFADDITPDEEISESLEQLDNHSYRSNGSGKVDIEKLRSVFNDSDSSKSQNSHELAHPAATSYYVTMEVYRHFVDLNDLLDFVTLNWRDNYVISHIYNMEMLQALQKRPFFLHISIDAPIALRYKRFQLRNSSGNLQTSSHVVSFEQFIFKNDELLFKLQNPLIEINNQAQVKIINTSTSIKDLYIKLSELNLLDGSRLRPTWDSYFMRLADLAALRSNCMKRRVGCVIVHDNRVVATGYNGTPRNLTNCNEGGCPRCNRGLGSGASLSTCLCLHAEENALLEAGRDRIRGEGVLYCNTCPCLTCSIKIVQSGIKEVVYAQSYSMDTLSHKVMSEANIVLRKFQPPTEGIFI